MYKWISFLMVFIALLVPLPTQAQTNTPEKCNEELAEMPTRHVLAHEMLETINIPLEEFSPNQAIVYIVSYSLDLRANQCGLQEQILLIIYTVEVWRLNMNYSQQLIDEEYYLDRLEAWRAYGEDFVQVAYCQKFTIACNGNEMKLGNEFLDSLETSTIDS